MKQILYDQISKALVLQIWAESTNVMLKMAAAKYAHTKITCYPTMAKSVSPIH